MAATPRVRAKHRHILVRMPSDAEGRPAAARVPRVLSIAGSDSGGGAGIQADLKAFARCGVHGMTALTAVTWQNTVAVTGVTPLPPEAIVGQVEAVAEDIGVDAVKIGMLGSVETIAAVARALDLLSGVPVVLDPVMIAESGADLLEPDARQALVELLPRATVATPNLHEASAIAAVAGLGPAGDQEALARAVHSVGPSVVVVTGGHGAGDTVVDLFFDGRRAVPISGPRRPEGATHGSGCTHSSGLAAHLALGHDPLAAARAAHQIAAEAVANGLRELGQGSGPVDVLGLRRRGSVP
jgi:hydroxymethylpyrimidine/phosphomethylpyrimidine kinase